jgi:hypothetical protein
MATETGEMIRIEKPAVPAIVARLAPVVSAAQQFSVLDVESDGLARERARALRGGEKEITELFERARKAADTAKKEILATRDGLIGPLAEARSLYERKALDYEDQERRKAEAEARRLQEIARKQEEDRILAEAEAAQNTGDVATAEAIISEPVSVPMVQVVPAVATVAGSGTRVTWSAEVFDFLAFVRHVAAHPEHLALLEPNGPNLNRLAVSLHEALNLPGVRAVSKTAIASRT